jgi:CDP-diacylglycerol pyrophosphatase
MISIHRARAAIGRVAVMAILLATPAAADHPNALWQVVHGLCLRDQRLTGHPAPCLEVNVGKGYAVAPDPGHRTQVLLVPTVRLFGIESPRLLEPGNVNYWQAAWQARRFVERRAGAPIPRDMIAMAINSAGFRSQDQLHIHVDCVRPEVREALGAYQRAIGSSWRRLPFPLGGVFYRARRLSGEDLGSRDPFRLLARGVPAARADMASQTLAVVGAEFADGAPGFFLLNSDAGAGFAESLLDHSCAVLKENT